VRLLVTVSNWNNKIGGFDQSIPQQILSSSERTQAQISSLVSQCVACGYAGIDLDWESLVPSDRDLFSGFVSQLATALHARDKVLSIDVAAKTDDLGTWPTAESEDYAALGQAVDEFKIMTYDYSGSWSGPGPIAPTSWVDHVIRYAESKVPAGKIWVGVPFYGYDWNGTKSRSATTDVDCTVARRLIQKYRPRIRRLPDKEATFTYRKAGRTHVVVYQDRLSLAAKLAVLRKRHPEIAGICIWVMGGEDKRFWPLIASALGHSA
jgi:spore germination protein YaaH